MSCNDPTTGTLRHPSQGGLASRCNGMRGGRGSPALEAGGVQSTGSPGRGCWGLGVPLTPSEAQSGVTGATLPTRASFFHSHHPGGRGLHIASSLGRGPCLPQLLLHHESFPAVCARRGSKPHPAVCEEHGDKLQYWPDAGSEPRNTNLAGRRSQRLTLTNPQFGFPYVVPCPASYHAWLSEILVSFSFVPLSLIHATSQHPWAFQDSSQKSPLLSPGSVLLCIPSVPWASFYLLSTSQARKGAPKGSGDCIPFLSVSPTPGTVPGTD